MGKTKTAVISGAPDEKELSGAEKYKLKQQKKAQEEAAKAKVSGVGMKGGERVNTVEGTEVEVYESKADEPLSPKAKRGPRTRGKQHVASVAKVDKTKLYPLEEAIKLVKETSYSKFDGTIELHAVTKKDSVSAQVTLPHSAGKQKKVVLADDSVIAELKEDKINFDIILATPQTMKLLVPFAKLLGPRGLMPNPKNGTLLKDKKDAKNFSQNQIVVKTERKAPLIHVSVGKVSQSEKEIKENINALVNAIGKKQLLKATLTSTMGPGVKVNLS